MINSHTAVAYTAVAWRRAVKIGHAHVLSRLFRIDGMDSACADVN